MLTCGTCTNNDDLLCDLLGILVEDDDEACKRYVGVETRKENQRNGEKEST